MPKTTSSINTLYGSIKGTQREKNKDNYIVIETKDYNLYAVFDGVSTAKDSGTATILAKKFIKLNHNLYLNKQINLQGLMFDVNGFILSKKLNSPYTTYCIVVIPNNSESFFFSSLGDSRIYMFSNQYIEAITTDDSLSENIITKFLGDDNLRLSDFSQKSSLRNNNGVLLCTDGFYKIMEEDKIAFFEIFQKKISDVIKKKIYKFIRNNNSDDATFIFLK